MIYLFIFLFFFAAFCSHDHLTGSTEVIAQDQLFEYSSGMSDTWTSPTNQQTQGVIKSHLRDASIETTRLQECVVNLQEKVERFKFELEDARQAEAARGDTIVILQNQVKRLETINAATQEELCTFRRKSNSAEIEIHQLKQRCAALKEERNKLRDDLLRCGQAPVMAATFKSDDSRIKKLETEKKLEEDRNRHLITHLEGSMYANKALILEKEALITENLADVEKLQEEAHYWKMKYKECVDKLDAVERSPNSSKLNWIKVQATVGLLRKRIASLHLEKNVQLKLADNLIRLNAKTNPSSSEISSVIIPILQVILRRVSLLQKADYGEVIVPDDVKSRNVVHVWYLLRNILSLLCLSGPSYRKDAQGPAKDSAVSELSCEIESSQLKDLSSASQQLDEFMTQSKTGLPDQSMGDCQNSPQSDNLVDKILDVANISRHFSKIGTQLRSLGEMFKENPNNRNSAHNSGDYENQKSTKSETNSDKSTLLKYEDKFTDLKTVSMQLDSLGKQFKFDCENVTKLSVLSQHLDKLGSHLHNLGELFSTYDVFFKSKNSEEGNHETDGKWAPQLSTVYPFCMESQNTSPSATTEEIDWNYGSCHKEISGFSHLLDSKVASQLDHLISDEVLDIGGRFKSSSDDEKTSEVLTQIQALFQGKPSRTNYENGFLAKAEPQPGVVPVSDGAGTLDNLQRHLNEKRPETCKDDLLPYPSWRTLLVSLWLKKSKHFGRRTVSEPSISHMSASVSDKNISSSINSDIPAQKTEGRTHIKSQRKDPTIGDEPKARKSTEVLKDLSPRTKKMAELKKINELQKKLNSEKLKRFSFSIQVKKLLSDLQRKVEVETPNSKRASTCQGSSVDSSQSSKRHRRKTRLDY